MAVYRYQAVAVGFWRGQVKRWNTTYHANSKYWVNQVADAVNKTGYKAPGDVVGACSGGLASVTVYGPGGGAPIDQNVFFDWSVPTEWIPYDDQVWGGVPAGTTQDASGESAMIVVGHLPGLSASGKPVTTRKYMHAIPSRTAATYSDPDIDTATAAAILNYCPAEIWASPSGVTPTTMSVERYYFAHQRVRGRRRTTQQVAAQSYSAGVVTGASACASGDAPFR